MSQRFNIHEDLQFRSNIERAEILAISGPTAQEVMDMLRDRNHFLLRERFQIFVNESQAAKIVAKYGRLVLR